MRDLIAHAALPSQSNATELFFSKCEKLITDHCYRVGIAAPALREADETEWVQNRIHFEPAQWILRIDIHRLILLPGSTVCMLIAEQLHKAEMTAVLIGQQAQLRDAVRTNTLLSDDCWHQAKAMLAPVCDFPVNRYLLQNIARNSPLAASVISCWTHSAKQLFDIKEGADGIDAALMSARRDYAAKLQIWIQRVYLVPIATSLQENYRLLANGMRAGRHLSTKTRLPLNAQRLMLPDISLSGKSDATRAEEETPVFFRADEHCEQIEILTLFDADVLPRNLDVVLSNLSQCLASQYCRAEVQPTSRSYSDVWLIRAKRLPQILATPTKLAGLFNEIEEEITALHACREHNLPLFRNGCAALNA
ncbi:MAG TPA: hypothetical protein VGM52_06755 [Herbaspirillum sp.]